jgi:hypothetical protein
MNNSQSSDGSGRTKGSDPLLAIAAATRDMWMLGASAVGNALAQGNASTPSPTAYLEQMLPAMSGLREFFETNVNAFTGAARPGTGGGWFDLLSLAMQANVAAGLGGLRYWGRLAQIHAAHQANVARALAAGGFDASRSGKEQRMLADEFRAYLREVGDLATQEARILQAELEKLAANVAGAVGSTDGAAEYRRRWKTKQ